MPDPTPLPGRARVLPGRPPSEPAPTPDHISLPEPTPGRTSLPEPAPVPGRTVLRRPDGH
ncbi:hypothetical protein [Actinocatenispora sera]|uniref:hypothetical protein n=1 Tax=Actinocatenispora sera TaxID=390989 RepID=UPI0004C3E8AA|nr:hypothetical protein [Actinocatenispora sera]